MRIYCVKCGLKLWDGNEFEVHVIMLSRLFKNHPRSVGETYIQHLRSAWAFSSELGLACLCCFAHGLFPCFFEKTGSEKVTRLYERMVTNRDKSASVQASDRSPTREISASSS